jgi:hypothetical protein
MLVILIAWTPFVVAGGAFAKLSEHAGDAAGPTPRHTIDDSRLAVALCALVAGAAILVAGAMAIGPFVRSRAARSTRALRTAVVAAAAATLVALAGGVGILAWAQHLPSTTREAGTGAYGVVFCSWAAIGAAALLAWTVAAVIAASQLELSSRQLRIDAALAHIVAVAMIAITIAVIVWWVVVGASHPPIVRAGSFSHPMSPFDLRLLAVVALMAVADAATIVGLWRVRTASAAVRSI